MDCDEVLFVLLGICGMVVNMIDYMEIVFNGVLLGEILMVMNDFMFFILLVFVLGMVKWWGIFISKIFGMFN